LRLIFRFLYKIILKKSFFINLLNYKNYVRILDLQKIYFYKNILNFYKLNLHLSILYSYQFKYSWIETKSKFDKFYFNNLENYFFIEFFQNLYNDNYFEKFFIIDNFIKHKNKFGLFKKINSIKSIYLIKNNFYKSDLDININKNLLNENLIYKNFDFVERKLFYFKNNRKFLKNIFKKNKKIKHYMNKFLKKISKSSYFNFLNKFEFSISNILLNSGFFLNKNDISFFIKNKYVFINNKVITDINKEINKGDIINICYNKYYYFLYRKYINTLNLNVNKYNNFFRKFTNNNLKNDFNFVNKIIFFKNDVPNYIEIDYISMSFILLYKNIFNYTCFDLKLLTSFLRRLNT